MLTGDIKNKINAIWNAFWSGGISNPLEVIEQITYLTYLALSMGATGSFGALRQCEPSTKLRHA